jgi:hypothetical protein
VIGSGIAAVVAAVGLLTRLAAVVYEGFLLLDDKATRLSAPKNFDFVSKRSPGDGRGEDDRLRLAKGLEGDDERITKPLDAILKHALRVLRSARTARTLKRDSVANCC